MPAYQLSFYRTIATGVLSCTPFIFSSGCSAPSHTWQCNVISNSSVPYTRLYLNPENDFKNLEIVILQEEKKNRVYLQLYGTPLKAREDGTYPVLIGIEGTENEISGLLLTGGQRIMLPESAEQQIVDALFQKKPITVRAGRYSTNIHYEGFENCSATFNGK